jgi:hypothetical protein
MVPDYFVNHVPGLYRARPNAGCSRQCDRGIVSRRSFSAVALQLNLVR